MIIARKWEVYFKDIFFVNIWELALARGFDEDDRTTHTVKGVANRDSLLPPSLQGVDISYTPLSTDYLQTRRSWQNIGLQVLKAEDCETVRL